MKRTSTTFSSLVAAALLSAVPVSAHAKERGFTPYEQLSFEDRIVVEEKVKAILDYAEIDFKTVKVGVDSDGKVVLKTRTEEEILKAASNPTCWGL